MEDVTAPVPVVCDVGLSPVGEDAGGPSCAVKACGLCVVQPAKYTCPRCNVPYCSLSCYRGSAHSTCSELFYKECVSEELRGRSRTEKEQRQIMREILLRLRKQEGAVEELIKQSSMTGVRPEEVMLLTRLAEIREGEEGHGEEAEEILHKLSHPEEEEEEEEDLVTRLSGLNVDSLSEAELWALLPQNEKQKFEELLKSGKIGTLIPAWSPWWEEHEYGATALVQELHAEEQQKTQSQKSEAHDHHSWSEASWGRSSGGEECKSAPPTIYSKIPALGSLCSTPSPSVSFSLVNVLYAYTFSLHLYNGDVWEKQQRVEFVELVLSVSESLGSGRTFHSTSEALCAAKTASVSLGRNSNLDTTAAVAHILSGRCVSDSTGYTLSALSHLRQALSAVRAAAALQHPFKQKCFLAGKKCIFLLAWTNENPEMLHRLAREVWRETGREREERHTMERQKRVMEEERRRRGRVLIQEL